MPLSRLEAYDPTFLARTQEKRRRVAVGETAAEYGDRLTRDRAEVESLVRLLRVSYSEFFRDPLTFGLLESALLPGLIEEKERSAQKEIRVWSAGCAAGQEAWSVALLLDELCARRGTPVTYRIFATDLSEPELLTAGAGVFAADALGNVRQRHLATGFVREGQDFVVAPHLRARVDFSVHDLLDPATVSPPASIFGDFDLVLSCNVLIYYCLGAQRLILEKLRRVLAPGGYLVTDSTERQVVLDAGGFRVVAPPAAVFAHVNRRGEP